MNITGRLTRDAEVKALPNDRKVVNFSIAVNNHYRNKQGEDIQQTAFFDCAYWQGTNVAKILTKEIKQRLANAHTTLDKPFLQISSK